MHRLSHTFRSLGVGLCRLPESELQGSRFLSYFWRVAGSDSFFKKSQLSNSRNLSLIHTTLHLIHITLLIFHAILHIFHSTYCLIWYWEKSRLQELWLLRKVSEWVGVALLGNRHNPMSKSSTSWFLTLRKTRAAFRITFMSCICI